MSEIHYFDRFGHDVTKNSQRFDVCACGLSGTTHQTSIEVEDVTCKSCKETKKFKSAEQAIESKRELSDEEFKKPKTQLEIDTKKYNLNESQVEYLSGFNYEVVKSNGSCKNCLFSCSKTDVTCGNIECDMVNSQFIFKQVHKTQSSLNEAIEKDSLKDGIEEPFETPLEVVLTGEDAEKYIKQQNEDEYVKSILEDDTTEEPNEQQSENHSSHYKKQNGELEDIEKMELIACHRLPEKYHKLTIENLNLALSFKYGGRLGKKDETEKEIDKMKNYNHRSVTNEWRK